MPLKVHKRSLQKHLKATIVLDPVESAKAVGLRYVTDREPGISRKRYGKKGFIYLNVNGDRIQDPEELKRINALAIPPAYKDVWICPLANGHLQATGRDAKGRKQYRYHPLWRSVRDQTKFTRMIVFSQSLPSLRERLEHDLSLPGLPKEKVLAAVLRLMELTRIRVGAYLDETLHQIMQKHAETIVENAYALKPEELAVVAMLEQQLMRELQQNVAC